MNIYLTQNGQQQGPYALGQLQDMVKAGTATMADFAWYEGLPNWVPLAQIPGMADAGIPIAEGPRERPVLVWIICLLNFTCLPFVLLSLGLPTLMLSSKLHLPEAQRHFFESQGLFNYYLPQVINFGLVLAWAIQLFRLKRNSIYSLLAALGVSVVKMLLDIFTTNWLHMVGVGALVGIAFGWGINGLLLYYNWYLIKTNVLR